MKARELRRRHVERLRWRLLIEGVAQGVEERLVEWLAEQCVCAAAEALTTALPSVTDLASVIHQQIGRSLAQLQPLRGAAR